MVTKTRKSKTGAKEIAPLELQLHSQCWLLNSAHGLHGPYFVLQDCGDEVVVSRHYVSVGMGGSNYSQWSVPMQVSKDCCVLLHQPLPKLHGGGDWGWFLGDYAKSMLRHCPPTSSKDHVQQVKCDLLNERPRQG